MRSFIAVAVPARYRPAMRSLRASLAGQVGGLRWVQTEGLHATLVFLGELAPERVSSVARRLAEAARRSRPFPLVFGGLTVFPHPRRATVLCVELGDSEQGLKALHQAVGSELTAEGFLPEARPFHPHVTIGRWRVPPPPAVVDALLGAPRPIIEGAWTVEEVRLMKSELTPEGSIYTILEAVPLDGEKQILQPPFVKGGQGGFKQEERS